MSMMIYQYFKKEENSTHINKIIVEVYKDIYQNVAPFQKGSERKEPNN